MHVPGQSRTLPHSALGMLSRGRFHDPTVVHDAFPLVHDASQGWLKADTIRFLHHSFSHSYSGHQHGPQQPHTLGEHIFRERPRGVENSGGTYRKPLPKKRLWTPPPTIRPPPPFWRLSVMSLEVKRRRPDQPQFLGPPKWLWRAHSAVRSPPPPNSREIRIYPPPLSRSRCPTFGPYHGHCRRPTGACGIRCGMANGCGLRLLALTGSSSSGSSDRGVLCT